MDGTFGMAVTGKSIIVFFVTDRNPGFALSFRSKNNLIGILNSINYRNRIKSVTKRNIKLPYIIIIRDSKNDASVKLMKEVLKVMRRYFSDPRQSLADWCGEKE